MASKKRYGGWDNPPPVTVVSGTEWFYKRREVQRAVRAARATGRDVQRVDGSESNALGDVLESAAFGGTVLAIVSSPGDVDFELIGRHAAGEDNTVCFLLYEESLKRDTGLSKFADDLPKQHRMVFNKPEKPHKHREYAVEFVIAEARRLGVSINADLAEALVDKAGKVEFDSGKRFKPLVPDLGLLHFELLKVATYMSSLKEGPAVTATHIKATLAVLGETDATQLTEALAKGSVKGVLREMDRLTREQPVSSPSERTVTVCSWLGSQVAKWLHAAALHEDGASESEAASRMAVHPWIYKAFLLPAARRWRMKHLTALLRRINAAEKAAKSSHINPWIELEAGLVTACRGLAAAG